MLTTAMLPPPGRRPSVRMLPQPQQLGMSGPLEGKETRDDWCQEPSAGSATQSLRKSVDYRVDASSAGGAADPSHLQMALGSLRRFVDAFPSR